METEALTPRPQTALGRTLQDALPELRAVAPKYCNVDRLVALAIELKMRSPLLAQCTEVSVVNFCKKCAEMGVDRVGAGGMWPVPFRRKEGGYEIVPMPDWRALIEKAKKAKAIRHATAEVVNEGDGFTYERGMSPSLIHRPGIDGKRGPLIAVYCVYTLPDGTKDFVVMDRGEIDKVRASSKAATAGPWVDWFDEMAKKTVVRRAMKLFEGASIELTAMIEADNAAVGFENAINVTPVAAQTDRTAEIASRVAKGKPSTSPAAGTPFDGGAKDEIPHSGSPPAGNTEDQLANVVTGKIEKFINKGDIVSGKERKGYSVKVAGEWYGTLHDTLGSKMADLAQGEADVDVRWQQDGKFRILLDIREAGAVDAAGGQQ